MDIKNRSLLNQVEPLLSEKQIQLISHISYSYGEERHLNQSVEEMSELIKAIMKLKRYPGQKRERLKDVAEEIADVAICLENLIQCFDIQEKVSSIVDKKIERELNRIANNTENIKEEIKK